MRRFLCLIACLVIGQAHAVEQPTSKQLKWLGASATIEIEDPGGGILPPPDAGPRLPLATYTIGDLPGTPRYLAPADAVPPGDDANACTLGAPCLLMSRAQTVATAGDPIIMRGGIYRGNEFSATKRLHYIAYPGELPEIRGSVVANFAAGTDEAGLYTYITYTEQPVDNGFISVTTGQNITGGVGGVGSYVDQAWIGTATSGPYQSQRGELRQVLTKAELTNGEFYVDATNNRMYLTISDANQADIEISSLDNFMSISALDLILEGLWISRYSPSANDFGMIDVNGQSGGGDGFICRDTKFSDISMTMLNLNGFSTDFLDDVTIEHCSIGDGNSFQGIAGTFLDGLTISATEMSNNDPWNEYTSSPVSGGIKVTRCKNVEITGSEVRNNKGHGIWFDQSCDTVLLGTNQVTGNAGTGIFFELSQGLTAINNLVQSTVSNPFKLGGGSSDLTLINNTMVGGPDVVGIYMDGRSVPGCANPSNAYCTPPAGVTGFTSDRTTAAKWNPLNDWMPRIGTMYNNIIAFPTSAGLCGAVTALCITRENSTSETAFNTIIHIADVGRGIPVTDMNNNAYAVGSGGTVWRIEHPSTINTYINYLTTTAFEDAMDGVSPFPAINNLEINSVVGGTNLVNPDGTPTAALDALDATNARVVPTDAVINRFVPAAFQEFGVTYQ